jgi:hypothetical protein
MGEASLEDVFYGPLAVSIVVGGETYTEHRDFQKDIVGPGNTLFDYVGSVAASVFTNMTTRLTIRTCPEEWRILEFSSKSEILKVEKISGEQWEIEDDNPDKLCSFLDTVIEYGKEEWRKIVSQN